MKKCIKNYMNDFLLYIQFFTRIPINVQLECSNENFSRGAMFFPVIGFIIGLIQYAVYLAFRNVLPASITAIFVVLSSIILTGALHLDGLGDICDGFFAFKGGKERIIEIMKDSRIGVYCCVAIVFDILTKYQLIKLSIDSFMPQIMIIAPTIGRFAVVFIAYIGKNAKETGTGNIFIGNIKKMRIIISLIIAVLLSSIFVDIKQIAIIILIVLVFVLLFNKFCESKINGLTGDTLGATNELVEMLVLMIFFFF